MSRPNGKRRIFGGILAVVALAATAIAVTVSSGTSCGAPQKEWRGGTNVILLSIDTLRRDHLPFYGYERATAPHLTELAERSIVFDSAIAVHTNTAPSHTSMLTGRYPAEHGVVLNGLGVRDGVPMLQESLKAAGYATGAFVSGWTLTEHVKLGRGFDVYDCDLPGDGERIAEDTVDVAIPWVRARVEQGKKFFLFLHFFDPHFPYSPPDEDAELFLPDGQDEFHTRLNRDLNRLKSRSGLDEAGAREYVSRYDGEIHYVDRHVGRFLDELERLGVAEDTLLVFVSDHGESHFERPWVFDHGGHAYDEQIRVPLTIRFPDGRGKGQRRASQVSHVDLMPTILEYLELEAPAGMAGRSLLPLVAEETDEDLRRPAFAHSRPEPARVPETHAALRTDGLVTTIRYPDVKLIEYPAVRDPYFMQLFDLRDDPAERHNLAYDQYPLSHRLHEQVEAFRRGTRADEVGAPPVLPDDITEHLRALGYVE
jgi:arylsulfatase A-like enzyme